MPIVETLGIALVTCAIPVLLLQQFELSRLGRGKPQAKKR